jgi:hypothetical protein
VDAEAAQGPMGDADVDPPVPIVLSAPVPGYGSRDHATAHQDRLGGEHLGRAKLVEQGRHRPHGTFLQGRERDGQRVPSARREPGVEGGD